MNSLSIDPITKHALDTTLDVDIQLTAGIQQQLGILYPNVENLLAILRTLSLPEVPPSSMLTSVAPDNSHRQTSLNSSHHSAVFPTPTFLLLMLFSLFSPTNFNNSPLTAHVHFKLLLSSIVLSGKTVPNLHTTTSSQSVSPTC